MRRADSFLMQTLYKRAQHNFSFIKPHILGQSILDIGSAEGWTGNLVTQNKPDSTVQLLDVTDLNQTDLPLTLYDGKNFPFQDNEFDTSLLLLILHHCDDPDLVLQEALRVTRKRLIVTESVYHHLLGRAALFCADNIVNGLRSNATMATGLKFKTPAQWEQRFADLGVSVHHRQWISRGFHKHILYVLDVGEKTAGGVNK